MSGRPITVLMLALSLSIFGWQSLKQLETSLLPKIEYPEFVIITVYKGAEAEEIENSVSIYLEEAISSLPDLQDIVSLSRDDMSIITAHFHWKIDHRFTLLRIREKIDAVYDRFPENAERPFIMDFNPASLPVLELILTGEGEADLLQLGDFAENVLKPRFSQIDGIAAAAISGNPDEMVQIELNSINCAQLGISAGQIIKSVKDNLPQQTISTVVRDGYSEYPLTVEFPYESPKELMDIPIQNPNQIPVKLSDVANVTAKPSRHHSLVFRDNTPSLLIQLYKESGAGTVSATRSGLELVDELSKTYPEMKLSVLNNRGEFVRQAINGLKQAIFLGAILAFIIILLFLQDIRYALLLSVVIPVSLLFVFNALFLHGISLNIMTLGGLALGLGLIVDNGIVVIESIFNEIKKKKSMDSVINGVRKVSRAITGSTLTTIAIFLPVIYVKGYVSVLFKQQALTIAYTLLISLISAVFLIPALYNYFILRKTEGKKTKVTASSMLAPVYHVFNKGYDKIESGYHSILIQALNHKKSVFGLLSVFLLCVGILYIFLPKQYWPNVPGNKVEIKVSVPSSVPFDIVKTKTLDTINRLQKLGNISDISTRLVDPLDVGFSNIQDVLNSPGDYSIYFSLELKKQLSPENFDREVYLKLIDLPYSDISIFQPEKVSQGVTGRSNKNFSVYISGENEPAIKQAVENLYKYFKTFEFVNDLSSEHGREQTVMAVIFNDRVLSFYQQSPGRLADDLLIKTSEKQIGTWREKLNNIPVIVRWDSAGVKSVETILNSFHSPGNTTVLTEQLITIDKKTKTSEVLRVNRKRVASVSANVTPHRLGEAVEKLDAWSENNHTQGLNISVAGESERIANSYRELFLAFCMSVILVYLILAAQFESFLHPLNIILTVPLGVAGAVITLTMFQQSLNVISIIGIVMLIGIGVNDAIIKVDYMNYLCRRKKYPVRKAIMIASREKFRPVIMTSLTTIVALLPMMFGFGGNTEMNRPLAITIIGGLFLSTTMTLIVTPLVFEAGEKLRLKYYKS